LVATLRQAGNDLEAPALKLAPEIGTVLERLRAESDCRLARMSGSGATCFGLFSTEAEAALAATRLARPGWWVWGGGFHQMPRRF
jgi:4-diphosphocytidyl-2-C-methyl-D-erythritol kinase